MAFKYPKGVLVSDCLSGYDLLHMSLTTYSLVKADGVGSQAIALVESDNLAEQLEHLVGSGPIAIITL